VILLDTDVVEAVMQARPDPAVVRWLDRQPARTVWLPVVVVFDLRCLAASDPDAGRRDRLQAGLEVLLEQLFADRIVPLDGAAVREAGALAARRRALGRPVDLRDALVAGTALARGALLATGRGERFRGAAIGLIDPFGF
jgi:hypothetical protein